MFDWVLNIPLIFKLLRRKLSRSLFNVKINSYQIYSFKGSCSVSNDYELLWKVTYFVQFYFLESLLVLQVPWSSVIYIAISNSFSGAVFLTRWIFPLNKGEMWWTHGYSRADSSKKLIIQSYIHLPTNEQWLAHFKILHV